MPHGRSSPFVQFHVSIMPVRSMSSSHHEHFSISYRAEWGGNEIMKNFDSFYFQKWHHSGAIVHEGKRCARFCYVEFCGSSAQICTDLRRSAQICWNWDNFLIVAIFLHTHTFYLSYIYVNYQGTFDILLDAALLWRANWQGGISNLIRAKFNTNGHTLCPFFFPFYKP